MRIQNFLMLVGLKKFIRNKIFDAEKFLDGSSGKVAKEEKSFSNQATWEGGSWGSLQEKFFFYNQWMWIA